MKDYPHYFELQIKLESPIQAETIMQAVMPDINVLGTERTKVEITKNGDTLKIMIKARDLVGLRASINSTLRWVTIAHETLFELSNHNSIH